MDLRLRIVALHRAGATFRGIAEPLMIMPSTAWKAAKRVDRTGSCAPGKMGGRRTRVPEGHADWIRARVEACPEIAPERLREELAEERGVAASEAAVRRFVRSLGFTHKKNGGRIGAGPRGCEERREAWKSGQGKLDPSRLVFLDET